MTGVLYIVATPIGNLGDISARAIATLKAVDLIAAEDTRHSRQLMNHLGVNTRMVSCHEHNENSRAAEILEVLAGGRDVALISDAGTPLISDPGFRLLRAARGQGVRISPIPGASSVIAALCAAGLPTASFYFCGFLSSRSVERGKQLQALRDIDSTLLLFESGRRIERMLEQVALVFPHTPCVVAKELTKLHEGFMHGEAAELLELFQRDGKLSKGEFVVLIDNSAGSDEEDSDGDIAGMLEILLDEVSVKKAVKIAGRLTGKRKNEIYQQALRLRDKNNGKPSA